MSIDSDDLDEDELLQMALKEQEQRDLSYQRNPKKPVVNLVQRPQPPTSAASRKPNPPSNLGQQKKPPQARVEDDDDSDVELLSISSGDEDVPRDRLGAQRNRGGGDGDPKRRVGGRADVGNGDQGWDGEEPNYWKYVDEAELVRRVREMRDARAAPVVPTFDRKASTLSRKGLNHLQSLPRGVEALDPLGMGIIDSRSLMLITEASESSPSYGDKNIKEPLDQVTHGKLNYYSEKFDAKIFLSRVHKNTSVVDLEAGALTLKTDLNGRTQQKKQLVKENFDCFVSCKTTIDDIESKLRQIEEDPEGSGTAQLHDATQKINMLANRAFQPLFERQVQAEKIRSVQGMLQRFRTLFNLPSAIRGSISKGEYDLAVREYRKAKSIVLPSHVGILKRVLEEVEKVMHEFKAMLHRSMEDPHLELADLENTVRLLLELEPDSDPIWHYLNIQSRRIRGLLDKCTEDHDARMEILHNEIRERELSDARWRQLQQDSNKSLDISVSSPEDSQFPDTPSVGFTAEDALRERYIRRLTAVLLHHIPLFWRLALSVFSGKFAKVSTGNMILDPETNAKEATQKTEEKVGDMKYSSHSLEEVAEMVHGTISFYEEKVLCTFRDFEESNVLSTYMIDVIKEIAKACQLIEGKDAAPSSAAMTLRHLHFEMTKIYILRLCSWMRATIEGLSETWIPLSFLERNKSPYTISFLPFDFRMISVSAMDQISMMIQRLRSEATNSNGMFMQIQDMQESIRLAFLNCFLDFSGQLEKLADELSQTKLNREDSHIQGYNLESGRVSGCYSVSASADSHKKLLIVLSNIGYCKDELCDELYRKYMQIWLPPREMEEEYTDIRDLVMSFSALEEKVLAQYTFAKASYIRTAALNYLLDAGIQWGGAPPVKGIRDATIELMNTLVSVHAEVSSGDKPLLEKTLCTLVEGLMDTFISLFHEHKSKYLMSIDPNGFCQLTLELEYLESVLHDYFSPEARESFNSLQDLLLEKASECSIEIIETPGHRRRPTRGSEDAVSDDRQQGATVSADDLITLSNQFKADLLDGELGRTRLNISCFKESALHPEPVKGVPKSTYSAVPSFRGPANPQAYRTASTINSFSRQKRR